MFGTFFENTPASRLTVTSYFPAQK
jgi:hypothetical protein